MEPVLFIYVTGVIVTYAIIVLLALNLKLED